MVKWHRIPTTTTTASRSCFRGTNNNEHTCSHRGLLQVSNPSAPLPLKDVEIVSDFVTNDEAKALQEELDELGSAYWEGYVGPQRRVQEFRFDSTTSSTTTNIGNDDAVSSSSLPLLPVLPPSAKLLRQLHERLYQCTGLQADGIRVEEYEPDMHKLVGQTYDPTIISMFASQQRSRRRERPRLGREKEKCSSKADDDDDCQYFVAEIPLRIYDNNVDGDNDNNILPAAEERDDEDNDGEAVIQSWNEAEILGQAMCFAIKSPEHWTDVRLPMCSALVKRREMLTKWRCSRMLTTSPGNNNNNENMKRIRVLQFYRLPGRDDDDDDSEQQGGVSSDDYDAFGYVPRSVDKALQLQRMQEPMPPLKDLLTIIVTTSPIKSNPSTEVLEHAMETLLLSGTEFAYQCRKVIVCDGVRKQEGDDPQKVTRKHRNFKQAMRNGIVTDQQAEKYRQYKENLRTLCNQAADNDGKHKGTSSDTSLFFSNAEVVELEERHGYGFALRHALRHCVHTPFVCVIQHDRTFMRPTPVLETVRAMWHHSHLKYIGFSMRSNLMYRDIFMTKYGGGPGHPQQQIWDDMLLRVPELCVDASVYGPDSASTDAMDFGGSEKLRKNILALVDTYRASHHAEALSAAVSNRADDNQPPKCQMSLIPTLFWYDNVHICDTAHYRDFVFHEQYKMVARGGFVEDKLSPAIKRTVERLGLHDGHSRFGCYLLDDHSGMFFTGHLDGGAYVTSEERKQLQNGSY